ncbi:beta-1,4 N-acetylgalactosaminyltransferase 1 [Aplochiton taeniatus]
METLWIPPSSLPKASPCTCPKGAFILKDHLPKEQYEELVTQRAEELRKHNLRTKSRLNTLLIAPSNSPLQYPIQGFRVRPLVTTLIPGLALHLTSDGRKSFKVSLKVTSGVLDLKGLAEESQVKGREVRGQGQSELTLQSEHLEDLNALLSRLTYTSTVYHTHTGDLGHVVFEDYQAVFPIVIQLPSMPVLYDVGNALRSHVSIATKTFLRYPQLNLLIDSVRRFYQDLKIIIADDSHDPQKITGDHIEQYIMPPAQGWFAGRNLAVSQVTTKYFLWVDDDFLFTEQTRIESLVEVMETTPELDMEGEEDGGCLVRKSHEQIHPLPGFPQCTLVSGVVNFFLARTDAVRKVGFDPRLQRLAHSEFFMDGLGSLMVASCSHVTVDHQPKAAGLSDQEAKLYASFRQGNAAEQQMKMALHFYKNHLKCVHYG